MQDIKKNKNQNNYNIDFIDTMINGGGQNIRKRSTIHKNHWFFSDYYLGDQSVLGTCCLLVLCFINVSDQTHNLEINAYFIIFLWKLLLFTIDLTEMKGLPLTRASCWHFEDELLNFWKWINWTIIKTVVWCLSTEASIHTITEFTEAKLAFLVTFLN